MEISYITPAVSSTGEVLEDFVYIELATIEQIKEYIDSLEKQIIALQTPNCILNEPIDEP